MNDLLSAFPGALQGFSHSNPKRHYFINGKFITPFNKLIQRYARYIFHSKVIQLTMFAGPVNLDNMLIRQFGQAFRLSMKTTHEILIAGQFFLEDFYGHCPIKRDLFPFINFTPTAFADELIGIDFKIAPGFHNFILLDLSLICANNTNILRLKINLSRGFRETRLDFSLSQVS